MKYTFIAFLFMLFAFGCSKSEKKIAITDQTYFIKVFNFSGDNSSLTIKTSLEKEKTFTIPKSGEKEISFLAAAGEYVKFTVPNNVPCIYRVLDSKGVTIALYEGLPSPASNPVELDFIAFPPNDTEKDFMKYKTGMAKAIGDNLIGRPYLLSERYYLENGIKTDNSWVQESCSFNDEYQFQPQRGEYGNFNPQRLGFLTLIDKDKSSCSYGSEQVIPTGHLSIVVNGNNTISFPIWDQLSIDGAQSYMTPRQLTIDSINSTGILTLHREVDGNKKEVFVYKPK